MRQFTEDAKNLLEGKIPLELSNKINTAKTIGVSFNIGRKSGGTIYGEPSQDAVGVGWIYIDIGQSKKSGGHLKIDMDDIKDWKYSERHSELRLELK